MSLSFGNNETEEVEFAAGAENIVFSKWVPQTALLADSRLSAFLTHGGLGSVNELSYMGKPSILCPLFGDQLRNAKMLARHNGSIEISKFDLPNFANLRSALHRILFDESYQRNAENLAKRLEKQPFKPKEMLVRHFEFGAE
uniref:glucuronosyltransferase n=2 Tax=Caenorhabditis japonica TaxID=281687 RepID=A0A8R1DKM2_CAEJA